jgi:hypothetical protein
MACLPLLLLLLPCWCQVMLPCQILLLLLQVWAWLAC